MTFLAVAFGYLEALIHLQDLNQFDEEEARLRSMYNILDAAGYDRFMYEDFADELFTLIRRVKDGLLHGTAEDILIESFNEDMVQNYVITHIKVCGKVLSFDNDVLTDTIQTITSAWMKTHTQDFAAYIPGQTIHEFCQSSILPVGCEIDYVGLMALKDVLLSPAGITLEVLYLDRSGGDEVNMHRFSPIGALRDIGTIRLLYRP